VANDTASGHVDLLILSTLDDGPAHGYAIVDALRVRSEGAFDFAEGTVYPALYRLERRGLLTSRWESATRRRRVYRLTRRGAAELVGERARWRRYVRAMEAVVS
jgi:DNA-binding PadR family transcriptional regulator